MREPIHIPAGRAWLCHDCNAVGNSGVCCPACASAAVYPLLSLLDGKPVQREQEIRRRA
jgi:hypothetical protein